MLCSAVLVSCLVSHLIVILSLFRLLASLARPASFVQRTRLQIKTFLFVGDSHLLGVTYRVIIRSRAPRKVCFMFFDIIIVFDICFENTLGQLVISLIFEFIFELLGLFLKF